MRPPRGDQSRARDACMLLRSVVIALQLSYSLRALFERLSIDRLTSFKTLRMNSTVGRMLARRARRRSLLLTPYTYACTVPATCTWRAPGPCLGGLRGAPAD